MNDLNFVSCNPNADDNHLLVLNALKRKTAEFSFILCFNYLPVYPG